jgi:hypothetical protein
VGAEATGWGKCVNYVGLLQGLCQQPETSEHTILHSVVTQKAITGRCMQLKFPVPVI